MKNYSVIIPGELNEVLTQHLVRPDGQEDLCFATYKPSTGKKRLSGIVANIILPKEEERIVHGNVSFLPEYVERVLRIARERSEGVVFIHSHPFPGWQDMSEDDVIAEKRLSQSVFAMTQLPLIGMTVGEDGLWSARFWTKDKVQKRTYNLNWCETARVISKQLKIIFNDNLLAPNFDSMKQLRTISAWGKKTQEDISRLRIGIVGLGSVGAIVAENLARTGISFFTLIDFDSVEDKNLDRLINVFPEDVGKAKVDVIRKAILLSATSPNASVEVSEYSICEKKGYLAALDCDVLFCCVDRPWPRQILNYISYAHLIPVIDGGILVRTNKNNTRIIGADWKVQTVGYNRACLECLGQYKTENANLEKSGFLDDPSYLAGLPDSQIFDAHENVFAFSANLASLEVLQLLSLAIAPSGIADLGQQMYHFVNGTQEKTHEKCCCDECYFQSIVGLGDRTNIQVYGRHILAEKIRNTRKRD